MHIQRKVIKANGVHFSLHRLILKISSVSSEDYLLFPDDVIIIFQKKLFCKFFYTFLWNFYSSWGLVKILVYLFNIIFFNKKRSNSIPLDLLVLFLSSVPNSVDILCGWGKDSEWEYSNDDWYNKDSIFRIWIQWYWTNEYRYGIDQ